MIANRSMPPSTVTPVLVYPDLTEAVDWLCDVFGLTERIRIGNHRSQLSFGDGSIVAAESPSRTVTRSSKARSASRPGSVDPSHSVMVRVPDVDRHHQRSKRKGARILQPPTSHPYGERQYSAVDLGGHSWMFSQSIADVAPEDWGGTVVNPGR